ncbi:hypothetical protein HispidOSU_026856, partial [Sigmodon hispidus]
CRWYTVVNLVPIEASLQNFILPKLKGFGLGAKEKQLSDCSFQDLGVLPAEVQ